MQSWLPFFDAEKSITPGMPHAHVAAPSCGTVNSFARPGLIRADWPIVGPTRPSNSVHVPPGTRVSFFAASMIPAPCLIIAKSGFDLPLYDETRSPRPVGPSYGLYHALFPAGATRR